MILFFKWPERQYMKYEPRARFLIWQYRIVEQLKKAQALMGIFGLSAPPSP